MKRIGAAFIAGCLLVLAGGSAAGESVKASRQEKVMGMPVVITVWAQDHTVCARALEKGFCEFSRVESVFSIYRQGSQINEINQFAARRPVRVSPEVIRVLQWSQSISELTQGAFDITVASYAWEYGFGHGDYHVPSSERLEYLKDKVDYRYVMLVPKENTVLFKREGVQIDMGGIAKSHALNTVRAMLEKEPLQAALINAGGDVAMVRQKPDGKPWKVGVRHPRDPGRLLAAVEVPGGKVLSSGDYQRFFEQEGKRYHHILDAKSGHSAPYSMAATLWLPENPKVDLPSVVLMLLPPEQALVLVQTIPQAEALIVDCEQKVWMTPGWQNTLKIDW